MQNNKQNGANTARHKYLLSGLIECGKCGGTFTGRTSKSRKGYVTRSYVCGNKSRTHSCDARNINADELEAAVVIKVKELFARRDFDTMAEEIYKSYIKGDGPRVAEKKELAQIERKLSNGTRAILAGADFSELNEEMARLRVRKAELEDILSISPDLQLTKKAIADKLREDAGHIQSGDIERLIKAYITKIYAHSDEVIITGGVNLNGCGGMQCPTFTIQMLLPLCAA